MTPNRKITTVPADPYDAEAWLAFYAANPGWRRGVGAEGVNDPQDPAGDDPAKEDPKDPGKPDDPAKEDPKDPGKPEPKDDKPTDREAQLLKDMMKHKERAKTVAGELEEFKKRYEGIDPDEVRSLLSERKEAETRKLEEKGEFEAVKKQMREEHEANIGRERERAATLEQENAELKTRIEDLTTGVAFGGSKFVREDLTLSPQKARQLWGGHFGRDDEGNFVAYDKPSGAQGRAPLVDGSGNPLDFDAALRRLVESDPDKDSLLRAKAKPGGGSAPGSRVADKPADPAKTPKDKIASGLASALAAKK